MTWTPDTGSTWPWSHPVTGPGQMHTSRQSQVHSPELDTWSQIRDGIEQCCLDFSQPHWGSIHIVTEIHGASFCRPVFAPRPGRRDDRAPWLASPMVDRRHDTWSRANVLMPPPLVGPLTSSLFHSLCKSVTFTTHTSLHNHFLFKSLGSTIRPILINRSP